MIGCFDDLMMMMMMMMMIMIMMMIMMCRYLYGCAVGEPVYPDMVLPGPSFCDWQVGAG